MTKILKVIELERSHVILPRGYVILPQLWGKMTLLGPNLISISPAAVDGWKRTKMIFRTINVTSSRREKEIFSIA